MPFLSQKHNILKYIMIADEYCKTLIINVGLRFKYNLLIKNYIFVNREPNLRAMAPSPLKGEGWGEVLYLPPSLPVLQ